ncbi:MAG: isopentenyl-diphosphate Delta-isomerase [Gemmatimonadota bacterium]|nr:isopentenyl-diphosphate Delta-isomerase [Gemmatimonadota bacterium]
MPEAPAEERVILVDENDVETGTAEKLHAHRQRLLHRAVSVFVLDTRGTVLLQRRAAGKYHSGGLWSNTCCSHPRPGEPVEAAATRRLREEMGLECPLRHAFTFTYAATLDGGLHEHEYDHVFVGTTDADPRPDPIEVSEWRRVSLTDLRRDLAAHPERYVAWFARVLAGLSVER